MTDKIFAVTGPLRLSLTSTATPAKNRDVRKDLAETAITCQLFSRSCVYAHNTRVATINYYEHVIGLSVIMSSLTHATTANWLHVLLTNQYLDGSTYEFAATNMPCRPVQSFLQGSQS